MANDEEVFRPRRPQQNPPAQPPQDEEGAEGLAAMNMAAALRQQAANEAGEEAPNPGFTGGGGFEIKGSAIPTEFLNQLQGKPKSDPKRGFGQMSGGGEGPANKTVNDLRAFSNGATPGASASSHLKELLEGLKGSTSVYEEVELPSRGRFYENGEAPGDGIVSIRPMTGEEEQILATPRFVRKGQAINMIFQRCLKDQIRPENLLTIDRTYLLIYLRGISYSPNYEVEVKCPECEKKFSTTIDLNTLYVEPCPDDYGPTLQDVLPTTKLPFSYRLSTGRDEQEITDYRDRRIKNFGDASADDTLIYRTSMLLEHIDGLTNKMELQILLKNLPISDVSHIRNCINEPPFGVDTNIEISCPSCLQDFEVDLPLEANFFFPRRKKEKTPA